MQYNVTYRQKDNNWQYIISYKVNGSWKQKSKQGFKMRKNAKEAADKRIEELKKEVDVTDSTDPEYVGITFGKFAEELNEHEKLYKAHNTIAVRKVAISRFNDIKNIPLIELKHSDIQKCVDKMVKDDLKLSSINIFIGSIKYILNQAIEPYGIISTSPIGKIKLPAMQKENNDNAIRALTKEESAKLLKVLKSKTLSTKYYYVCALALNSGLRKGELLGLTWADIDFSKKEIHVEEQWKLIDDKTYDFGTLKRKKSKRTIPISDSTIAMLKEYRNTTKALSFDNRLFLLDGYTINVYIKKVSKSLGFNATLHILRHTYATNLIASGIDFKTAAAILGHDVEMTMKVYSHVTDDMMKAAAEKINNYF